MQRQTRGQPHSHSQNAHSRSQSSLSTGDSESDSKSPVPEAETKGDEQNLSVEVDRNADTGITVGQGNSATVFQADLQAGYIINPVSNLRLFANVAFRNIDPEANTASAFNTSTAWFNIGVRTDLFNWYNDF